MGLTCNLYVMEFLIILYNKNNRFIAQHVQSMRFFKIKSALKKKKIYKALQKLQAL